MCIRDREKAKIIPCILKQDALERHLESDIKKALSAHVTIVKTMPVTLSLIHILKLTGFEGSHTVTKGDVSFARLIIESSYILDNWNDPHVYMQMKGPDGQVMVCTSSWLHWAREVTCMVNCFYCHVRPENPIIEAFEAGDTGCSPIDLYTYLFEG